MQGDKTGGYFYLNNSKREKMMMVVAMDMRKRDKPGIYCEVGLEGHADKLLIRMCDSEEADQDDAQEFKVGT